MDPPPQQQMRHSKRSASQTLRSSIRTAVLALTEADVTDGIEIQEEQLVVSAHVLDDRAQPLVHGASVGSDVEGGTHIWRAMGKQCVASNKRGLPTNLTGRQRQPRQSIPRLHYAKN